MNDGGRPKCHRQQRPQRHGRDRKKKPSSSRREQCVFLPPPVIPRGVVQVEYAFPTDKVVLRTSPHPSSTTRVHRRPYTRPAQQEMVISEQVDAPAMRTGLPFDIETLTAAGREPCPTGGFRLTRPGATNALYLCNGAQRPLVRPLVTPPVPVNGDVPAPAPTPVPVHGLSETSSFCELMQPLASDPTMNETVGAALTRLLIVDSLPEYISELQKENPDPQVVQRFAGLDKGNLVRFFHGWQARFDPNALLSQDDTQVRAFGQQFARDFVQTFCGRRRSS